MNDNKCKKPKGSCKGTINKAVTVDVMTGCCPHSTMTTHPCNECGLLHRENGNLLVSRRGEMTVLKDSKVLVGGVDLTKHYRIH